MTTKAEPTLTFSNAAEWRGWLAKHHGRSGAVLLRTRRGRGASSRTRALHAALEWGSIDRQPEARARLIGLVPAFLAAHREQPLRGGSPTVKSPNLPWPPGPASILLSNLRRVCPFHPDGSLVALGRQAPRERGGQSGGSPPNSRWSRRRRTTRAPAVPTGAPPTVEEPARRRTRAVYLMLGFGSPVGGFGVEGVQRFGSYFELAAGFGVGDAAANSEPHTGLGHVIQWALMPRLRLGDDATALTVGAGISGGEYGYGFIRGFLQFCDEDPCPTDPSLPDPVRYLEQLRDRPRALVAERIRDAPLCGLRSRIRER